MPGVDARHFLSFRGMEECFELWVANLDTERKTRIVIIIRSCRFLHFRCKHCIVGNTHVIPAWVVKVTEHLKELPSLPQDDDGTSRIRDTCTSCKLWHTQGCIQAREYLSSFR